MNFSSFIGPSYRSQSGIAEGERSVNWYPEIIETQQGKNRWILLPVPGVVRRWTLPNGPCRGMFAQDGRVIVVAGPDIVELFDDDTYTVRGNIAVDQYPATLCSNGAGGGEVFITSGGQGKILNLTTNVVSSVVVSAVRMGAFLDGWFLALDPETSTLHISGSEDGLTWNPLQIIQRNTGGDKWQSLLVSHRLIYLFGSQSSDVYYNAGTSPIPFEAIQEGFMQQGILAPFALTDSEDGPIWIGQSSHGRGVVYQADGYTPKRISDHGVEHQIQSYATVNDAIGFSQQDQGHGFSSFTFPTALGSWAYDAATTSWHERLFWNAPLVSYQAARPLFHCFAFGAHLVGDRSSADIYEQSVTQHLDVGGANLRCLRRSPHLSNEHRWITIKDFTLDMDTGVGTTTGAGANPQAMLRWSTDGGMTWSNEHWADIGKQGAYGTRVNWTRLGRGRDRVFEVVISDPVPRRLINAYLEVA